MDTGIYKVVYFSFGFEAINSAADRSTTMERVLAWIEADTTVQPVVQVSTDTDDDYDPALVQAADGTLLAVWYSYRSGTADLWYKTSGDDGATWSTAGQLATETYRDYDPALARAADDTLWLVWRSRESGNYDLWYKTSTDDGASWSAATQLTTDPGPTMILLSRAPPTEPSGSRGFPTALAPTRSGTRRGTPGTGVWSADTQLTAGTDENYDPTIAQAADGKIWVVWEWDGVLVYRTTSNGGASWSAVAEIDGDCCPWAPSLARAGDGSLWLASVDYSQIAQQTSGDDGATWSTRHPWTRFEGWDQAPYLAALDGGRLALVWESERSENDDIWFGILGEREDLNPPPKVKRLEHEPAGPAPGEVVTFRAYAEDETAVDTVHLVWELNGAPQADVEMYDDGAHNDYGAGDGWYGVQAGPFALDDEVSYSARASDGDGNTYTRPWWESFLVVEPFVKTADLLFIPDYDGESTDWFRTYFTDALDDLGRDYDLWDTGLRGAPGGPTLNQYVDGVVIWAAPDWGFFRENDVQDDLAAYLDAGGRLFITGQDIGYYEGLSAFYQNYLHATYVQDDTNLYALSGQAGDPVGDGLALSISGGDGADNQDSPDEIDPVSPAVTVLTYDSTALQARDAVEETRPDPPEDRPEPRGARRDDGRPQSRAASAGSASPLENISSGTAGLRVDTGIYRVVYFSFGFEAINSAADRNTTMERVLDWLGVCEASHSLAPDWTLLAPNVDTDPATDAEAARSEVAAQGGNALQLCAWLGGTQNWLCYDGDPPGNNFPIELGQGYFFQVDTASTWQRTGQAPGSPVPVDIRPTWSLVGIPRLPGLMTAEDLLDEATGQGGACTELYRWQAGGWVGHARGLPFNNFGLTNNEGYFARCASATTYIPGAAATQAQPESWPAMVEQETLAPVADPTISDIQVTNRRDVALTITWLTDQPSTGWVEYGDTPALGQTAYDDKGEGTVSQAHHVTLTGLTPETTYDFRVHSGETIDDNDGALYQVTTRATELPPTPYLAYGRVETAEGAPAVGALVRVWLVDEAGNEAEPVSALVDGYGYWSLSLPVDRCKDLQVKLQVTGRQGSSAEITQPACEVKPAPTVVAGVKGGAGVYLPIVMR